MSFIRNSKSAIASLAVAAVVFGGCGGDDDERSDTETTISTTAASDKYAPPTEAELRAFPCRKVEFGLTATDTVYLVSAVQKATGVVIDTAAAEVEDICRKGKPSTKPYVPAVRALGGELP